MIKLAVMDAFSMAATLIAYHRTTEGLEPSPEWKTKLEGVSSKFGELGRKAKENIGSQTPNFIPTIKVPTHESSDNQAIGVNS